MNHLSQRHPLFGHFKLLDLGNIIGEVPDPMKVGQGLGGNIIAEILLDLHGQFDGIQRVQPVLGEHRIGGDPVFVGGSEVVFDQGQHVVVDVLGGLQDQVGLELQLAVVVCLEARDFVLAGDQIDVPVGRPVFDVFEFRLFFEFHNFAETRLEGFSKEFAKISSQHVFIEFSLHLLK